jgi:prepilin-type N-terminal cleavage/methylation domain-containing protein
MKRAVPAGRQGISLIELLIAVVIFLVLIGGAVIYINNFNSRQKLNTAREEIVSYLRMARNYAITRQNPDGVNLTYVEVSFNNGVMTVVPNGVGTSYFAKSVTSEGVTISMDPATLLFSGYEGKMVKLSGGELVPADINEKTVVLLVLGAGVGESTSVEVNSSGLIN